MIHKNNNDLSKCAKYLFKYLMCDKCDYNFFFKGISTIPSPTFVFPSLTEMAMYKNYNLSKILIGIPKYVFY